MWKTKQNCILPLIPTTYELGLRLEFSEKTILSVNEIDLLGVTIDTNSHITKICRKASRQLNALKRNVSVFILHFDTRKTLANSCITSNFNYCPLVWYFSTAKQLQKIERIQERVLRFLHDNCVSDYLTLLTLSGPAFSVVRQAWGGGGAQRPRCQKSRLTSTN